MSLEKRLRAIMQMQPHLANETTSVCRKNETQTSLKCCAHRGMEVPPRQRSGHGATSQSSGRGTTSPLSLNRFAKKRPTSAPSTIQRSADDALSPGSINDFGDSYGPIRNGEVSRLPSRIKRGAHSFRKDPSFHIEVDDIALVDDSYITYTLSPFIASESIQLPVGSSRAQSERSHNVWSIPSPISNQHENGEVFASKFPFDRGFLQRDTLNSQDMLPSHGQFLALMNARSQTPHAISNSGLIGIEVEGKVMQNPSKTSSTLRHSVLVGQKSGLASGPPKQKLPFQASPPPSQKTVPFSKMKMIITKEMKEEIRCGELTAQQLRLRENIWRKDMAAIRIQKVFRGILARERARLLEREEHPLHATGLRTTMTCCGGCPFNHLEGHTVALTKGGKVYTWGSSSSGQLGLSTTGDSNVPMLVGHCLKCNPDLRGGPEGPFSGKRIKAVAAGGLHTLALTEDGRVYGWGSAGYGQLGSLRNPDDPDCIIHPTTQTDGIHYRKFAPSSIPDLPIVKIVACGRYHSLAVTYDGRLFTWGQGVSGQLGHGSTVSTSTPTMIKGLCGVKCVAGGVSHSAAVTDAGKLFAWGHGGSGRLGHGNTDQKLVPTLVGGDLPSIRLVQCGDSHTLALSDMGGRVFAFGSGAEGQLGYGGIRHRVLPIEVHGLLKGMPIKHIAAGSYHSAAVTQVGGRLFTWGRGDSGQLGNGSDSFQLEPAEIFIPDVVVQVLGQPANPAPLVIMGRLSKVAKGLVKEKQHRSSQRERFAEEILKARKEQKAVVTVSCGPYQTVAVTADGTTFMCGHGGSGQLGNASNQTKFDLTRVAPPGKHRVPKIGGQNLFKEPYIQDGEWVDGVYELPGQRAFEDQRGKKKAVDRKLLLEGLED